MLKFRHSSGQTRHRVPLEGDVYQPPVTGVVLLQALIGVLFLVFVLRFWFLQVHLGEDFSRQALANRLRYEEILASRGRIVDAKNVPLADNQIVYGLSLVREDCDDIPATLAQAAMWTGVPLEKMRQRFDQDKWRTQKFEPILLASDMDIERASRIESELVSWPGLEIVVRSKRRYPEGEIFAHVLGYVAEANEREMEADPALSLGDLVGKQGLELSYEKELRGRKGKNEVDVDAMGRALERRMLETPCNGKEIRLTLDRDLQLAAWNALNGEAGSVVVMEPETGKVRALVTSPAYDNNLFSGGISYKNWEELRKNPRFPLQNRVIQSVYPPGSVWKLMMAAMFLENNISPEDGVYCSGSYRLGSHVFHCWKRHGHGYMNMRSAILNSCDVYFYHNAEKVGIDRMARFAHASGFGRVTGIDLPHEKAGVVPSREWKMRRFGKAWLKGETINASIGQGYTLVTPLQMAVNVCSFLNGGMILKPLLREDDDMEIRSLVPAKPETLQFVVDAMRATASTGTARIISRPDADMGGKTGSAQVVKLRMDGKRVMKPSELPWEQRDHGWMATWGRKGARTYVVIVMVEHGGGGSTAAGPVAKRVYEHLFGYDPVRQRQIQLEKERRMKEYLVDMLKAERAQKRLFEQYQRQLRSRKK